MLYVVLLAMIAAFLALRLYMVLGRKTGHEQEVLPRAVEEPRSAPPAPRTVEGGTEVSDQPTVSGPLARGLRAIAAGDPRFDAVEFVEGAKGAYKMILEAFWKGDRETLAWLTEDVVAREFGAAIDAREAEGHTLDNRLVGIDRAAITSAAVDGGVAKIAVRFDADIASVTRDKDGTIVSGSMTDAAETREVWTFVRTLTDSDPNWKLADTDEA